MDFSQSVFVEVISRCLCVMVLSGVWIGSGCQTLHQRSASDASAYARTRDLSQIDYGRDGRVEDLDREAQLAPVDHDFARVLAYYSQGVLHAQHREAAYAATNFLKSLEYSLDEPSVYLSVSEKIYDQAKELIRKDEKDRALQILQRLVELKPGEAGPHIWKAVIHQAYKQNRRAESEYAAGIKRSPRAVGPYLELARIQYANREADRAISTLQDGIKRAREPLKAHRFLAEIYLKRADSAIDPGVVKSNRRAAIRTLEAALKKVPDDKTSLFHLGRLYLKEDDFAEGLGYYMRVEGLDPDNLSFKEQLAEDISKTVGDPLATRKKLQHFIREHPDNAHACFYLGVLYEKGEQPDKARVAFVKAARMEPAESAAYWKAALFTVDDDIDGARELLEQGLRRLPENPRITEMLAFIHLQQKDYARSITLFEKVHTQLKAKGVAHQAQNFHYNYALAAQGGGLFGRAAEHLIQAAVLNQDFVAGFVQHVASLEIESRYRDGLRTLREVSLDVMEPEVHFYIGLLSARAELYESAISAYRYAETMARNHAREAVILDDAFYFNFGAACEQARQYGEAEVQLERCISLNNKHIEAYNYLAFMWSEQGVKLDRALVYVNRALQEASGNGAFLDTRGWIYYKQGSYEKALADIEAAHASIPDDATIKDHLGDVHARLEQFDQAGVYWREALALDPGNPVLVEKLKSGIPTASAAP